MIGRVACMLLGAWLMMAPAVLGFDGSCRIDDRVIGPLVIAVSIVASHQSTRRLRWLVALCGLWLAASAGILNPQAIVSRINSLDVGLLLIGGAGIPLSRNEPRGGGWQGLVMRLLEVRVASEAALIRLSLLRDGAACEEVDTTSQEA